MREPTSLDELLAHEGFLRALVRGLVHGEAEVDDVLQETFTIALRRGPREPRALRGWLARVARNVAFTTRRADARRARREAASARPEGIPSPLEILEREATRRRLVHTVLALDPLYRDPIVLRWLEGLPVPEVAARLGVPLDTVKTRLRRGLERIRERLDERAAGDRRAWMLALAPLAGPALGPQAHPSARVAPPRTAAALRALSPHALSALAAATLTVGALVFLFTRAAPPRDDTTPGIGALPTPDAHATGLAAAPTIPGAPGTDPSGARPTAAEPGLLDRSMAFAPDLRPPGALFLLVVGLDGSTPAAGVAVRAEPVAPPTPAGVPAPDSTGPARTATTDRDGRFEMAGVPSGAWRVRARGAGGAGAETLVAVAADAGREGAGSAPWTRLVLAAPPSPAPLRVRVSGPDGRPVAGARVRLAEDDGDAPWVASSDEAGFASFPQDLVGSGTLEASHEGRVGWRRIADLGAARRDGQAWALGLDVAARVTGTVRDAVGTAVAGAEVQAWRWAAFFGGPPVHSMRARTLTDAHGAYALDDLPPGVHVLLVRGGGVALADPPGRTDGGLRWLSVRSGADVTLDLRVARGGTLGGQVLDEAGAPLATASVELCMPYGPPYGPSAEDEGGTPVWDVPTRWPATADHPYGRRTLATDANGRYRFDGLPASASWRLVASAPGRTFDARADVALASGETLALTHRLAPAGTLEALAPRGATVVVRRAGEERPVAALRLGADTGSVRLPGLAPGRYALSLRSWRPDGSAAPVSFEVRAGATTLVDLSTRILGRTRLTLRRDGLPLPGASSIAGAIVRIADTEGRVVLPGGAGAGAPVVVAVRAPERDATSLRVTWLAPDWEEPTFSRTLDLPDGHVRARVVDAEGRPVAGAWLRLVGSSLALGGDACADVDERRLTDGEGLVSFSGLPAGSFDLAVDAPPPFARATRTVRVPDDEAGIEIVLRGP